MRHYRVMLSDALAAHREALRFGGRHGVLNQAAIESALGRPYSGYHRSISKKAAALLHGIVQNHGFVDGNKRTALLVTLLLIERSGYRLQVQPDEPLDDVVVQVADGQMDFDDLTVWFQRRIRKR
ncbi:MAG: type II toxin-antitoxin system death-on-curing family toxin [Rhodobacteraceae bacterium]|nr:MAG: type II toxin-antitoxin system death-on-curing family toxin [Paracoccaceae bacterium]